MPKKRHEPEEIAAKLRQVDVMVSQGQSVADAVRAISMTEVTDYTDGDLSSADVGA
jgi:putative transposase